jgi:hypothetical protein
MDRRWVLGVAALAVVLVGAVAWPARPRDPGPVAPPVTASELRQFDRNQPGNVTLLSGGSKSEAHRVWAYYSDRRAVHGVAPQLLGISRVEVHGSGYARVFWLVLSDHVWQDRYGAEGGRVLAREAVLVPTGSTSLYGDTRTF